jgi:hypothetical protein
MILRLQGARRGKNGVRSSSISPRPDGSNLNELISLFKLTAPQDLRGSLGHGIFVACLE